MRYYDHCHTLFLEFQHQIKQGFGIGFVQRRCRFIQDQQFRVLRERFRDLHKLLLTGSDFFYKYFGRFG